MTNTVKVPRELLVRLCNLHATGWEDIEPEIKELRALLDAPADPFNAQGWSIDHSAGRPILMHNSCSVIEAEQAYGLLELIKSAAQPQGEPVAHCLLRLNGAGEWINDAKSWADGAPCQEIVSECEKHSELYRVRLAYAEQPAPVAVVMPEHRDSSLDNPNYSHARGWNACLDEVTRLNPK
jgi:hypothetical protein